MTANCCPDALLVGYHGIVEVDRPVFASHIASFDGRLVAQLHAGAPRQASPMSGSHVSTKSVLLPSFRLRHFKIHHKPARPGCRPCT
jgi:hypothetical protein